MQRPRPRRDAAGIFAQEFLSISLSPSAAGARSTSSQDRPQSSIEAAIYRRISWRRLGVFLRLDPSPSIYVDSASVYNLTLASLKDAARLTAYFIAIILIGALIAPLLFWASHSLATHGLFPFLAKYNFETFFHRAVLLAAAVLLWPFLYISGVKNMADLHLVPNSWWTRDVLAGMLLSAIPLLCCGALLIALNIYSFRHSFSWGALGKTLGASVTVPFIEETLFRGIVLGVLLRTGRLYVSIFVTSAIFSVIHFLKTPVRESATATWTSGFNSITHSFEQFGDLTLVGAAFTTLFLIGWILADARVLTRSLWLPIGLHAGWIFASGTFSRVARQQMLISPWLGKNLLVGIVPLGVAGLTWLIMRTWLKHDRAHQV
jgi:uncharacterized protein